MAFANDLAENIVAPATVPGTGAVGIIRLSGPDVITIADSILTLSSHTRGGAQEEDWRVLQGGAHRPEASRPVLQGTDGSPDGLCPGTS